MHKISLEFVKEMKRNTEMRLSEEDNFYFENAKYCSICKEPFKEGDAECREHCHRTGKYRSCTHQKCNIDCFCNWLIPVVFYNLKGYDSHFILSEAHAILDELGSSTKLDAIQLSYEKLMSFIIGCLSCIDSSNFCRHH